MPSPFTYQSMSLPDLAREPKGTIGIFFCEWDMLQKAQRQITAQFKITSQPVKGNCRIQSFNTIDTKTGTPFRVIQVEVAKPLPPRRKRGRKPGTKNKPKK